MKKALKFTLWVLPVAVVATFFTLLYQLDLYDAQTVQAVVDQIGSLEALIAISMVQTMIYVILCSLFGYILAEKVGLMVPIRFERKPLIRTTLVSVAAGVIFSLDYWTFGAAVPQIREATAAGMTAYGWIASILYGGVVEEILLRLFMLSLIAWVLRKLFFRRAQTIPTGLAVAANVIAALLFAAGHLPATVTAFGTLTPLLVIRCFLFNGGLGLLFGRLYRKYGIQYAMVSHALCHITSKLVWLTFL